MDITGAKCMIGNSDLQFTNATQLNDPFDWLVYTICRVWKRRISYYGPRNITCQDEPHNKKLRKVQDEMFEEVYNDNRA